MIYLLENRNPGFGTMNAIVVRADSSESARRLANTKNYGEGKIWDDETKTSCRELLPDGKEEVILDSVAD